VLRRRLPLSVAAVGVILLITGSVLAFLDTIPLRPQAADLPPRLAGLELSSRSDGPQAVAELGRMHAADLALESAAIGKYGDAGQVVVWLSQMPDPMAAFNMTEAMRTRINAVDSPFTQVALRPRQAGPITELEGTGQRHYFYASGSIVIWLGAEPALAEQALVNLREMYP
jgi:hypothetical protein